MQKLPASPVDFDNSRMQHAATDAELDLLDLTGFRRASPRVLVEAMCLEVGDDHEFEGNVLNLSHRGVRVERPYLSGETAPREVYLELAVPGIDEILIARGIRCFDQLGAPGPTTDGGPLGLVRRTGYRLWASCMRDLRILQEYVIELHRERLAAQRRQCPRHDWQPAASVGHSPTFGWADHIAGSSRYS